MNPSVENRPIRPWVLTIPLLLVIVGLLVAIATPNFVRSGPSKINCIINVLRNVDAAKEQWAVEHGYTNNIPLSQLMARMRCMRDRRYCLPPSKDDNFSSALALALINTEISAILKMWYL